MPYAIRQVGRKDSRYSVFNLDTGRVYSKGTTLLNAIHQRNLLRAHGGSAASNQALMLKDYNLNQNTKVPMSEMDLRLLCPGATILPYPDLANYTGIDHLFSASPHVIILYLLENAYTGHWTCLFRGSDGIHYFDSYGMPVDYQFSELPKGRQIALNESTHYLSKMLSHTPIIWNNIGYQTGSTQTCGEHCAYRLAHDTLTDPEYYSIFKGNPDTQVADWAFRQLRK